MNLHVRNFKTDDMARRRRNKSGGTAYLLFIGKVFFFGIAIFGVVTLRISINEKIERLNRQAVLVKVRIHEIDREIENIKIDRERLTCWPHIKKKVEAFKLALRFPSPEQVHPLLDGIPGRRDLTREKTRDVSKR
ncbi:MAG: hypothetical protein A2020_12835 [Lentisphaerae bacterium GWF2_45_14]|nr:MAG: hypothetical protein A2020_12835 [Lentisphaerae bacterium GWF2_45_14]